MANAEQGGQARAKLCQSTTVFLVGNIEPTIFLQQQPGYVSPDDPGRHEREAWDVYIVADDVNALYEEYSALPGVKISRPLGPQDYGMMEFDVMDLNGHRLVFAQPIPAE